MVYYTRNASETEEVGRALGAELIRRGVRRGFIAMRGEMGVGKTAFVRGFAGAFGILRVKSPTYTIVNEYTGDRGVHIYHFDMYRITDGDDLYSTGYDDYISRDGYCIAEWSENVTEYLPCERVTVTISRTDDESGRKIEITGGISDVHTGV